MTQYERRVLAAVDGVKTQTEISRELHHGWANGATYKALRRLERDGYVIRDPRVMWSADWKWFRTEKPCDETAKKPNPVVPTLF